MSRTLDKRDPFLLDRLLSGQDRLAPAERDQVFDQAVARAQGRASVRQGALWLQRLGLATGAAALGTLAFWLAVNAPNPADTDANSGFAHRGADSAAARLSMSCPDAPGPGQCRVGDKLLFEVAAPSDRPFFAAYARRGDGAVIWYFPARENEQSIEVADHHVAGVLERGILLGAEHSVGQYQVTAIFSSQPMTQPLIKRAVASGELEPSAYTVLQRSFSVEEASP